MGDKWIQATGIDRPGHKGLLRKKLGAKEGENIPADRLEKAARSKDKKLAAEARLALKLKSFHK